MVMYASVESYKQAEERYQSALEAYEQLVREYEKAKARGDEEHAAELYSELVPRRAAAEQLYESLSQLRQDVVESAPVSLF